MKKLYLILMCVLMIGTISAWNWDNAKDYNEETKEFNIDNAFGLGDTIAKIQLDYNTEYCIGRCFAEGTLILYEETALDNSLKFRDLNDKNNIRDINSNIFYLVTYEENCHINASAKTGETCITSDIRTEYKGESLKAGSYDWRIEGAINTGEKVDWDLNLLGIATYPEWDIWDGSGDEWTFISSFNTGIGLFQGMTWYDNSWYIATQNKSVVKIQGDGTYVDSWALSDLNTGIHHNGTTFLITGKRESGANDYCNVSFYDDAFVLKGSVFLCGDALVLEGIDGNSSNYFIQEDTTDGVMIYDLSWNQVSNFSVAAQGRPDKLAKLGGFFYVGDETNNAVDRYLLNGTYNVTTYSVSAYTQQLRTLAYNDSVWVTAQQSNGTVSMFTRLTGTALIPPKTVLIEPVAYYNSSTSNVFFNCTGGDDENLINVTFYINDVVNGSITNSSADETNLTFSTTETLSDGTHNWTCKSEDGNGETDIDAGRYFSVDTTAPVVNLAWNITDILTTTPPVNSTWNYSVTDDNLADCYYNSSDNVTFTIIDCNLNTINTTWETVGAKVITYYANDTNSLESYRTKSFNVAGVTSGQKDTPDPIFETANLTITLQINSTAIPTTTASLLFNNTYYEDATVSAGTNQYNFTKVLNIPEGWGNGSGRNIDWRWNYTITGITNNANTSEQNVTVYALIFGVCNATNTVPYINFTFLNETVSEENINASIDSFEATYRSGAFSNTYSYSNTSELPIHSFCTIPSFTNLTVDYELDYNNAESQQRTVSESGLFLTNTSTVKTLFLLPTSVGQFVTITVVNPVDIPLTGVNASVKKDGVLIEEEETDGLGKVNWFLDPDASYDFTFTHPDYDAVSTSFTPSASAYTITLGGSIIADTNITEASENYWKGMATTIRPRETYLINETTYSFNFSITTNFWNISEFGFTLSNTTDILDSDSASTNGGIVNINLDTGLHDRIILDAYWVIGGNYTNTSKSWVVVNSGDTDYSILKLFTDIDSYLDVGILGLSNTTDEGEFGVAIIIFLGMFLFVGVLSFKFGLRSPETILVLIFGMVLFLDVGVGIMPNPLGVNYFPTIFVGILAIGIYLREVSR